MENPVDNVLWLTSRTVSTSEAVCHLREVLKVMDSLEFSGDLLSVKTLTYLSKITSQFKYQLMRHLVKIYGKLCEVFPRGDLNILIILANDVYLLCSYLAGTYTAGVLEESVVGLLTWMRVNGSLDPDQLEQINCLLERGQISQFDDNLKLVLDDLKDSNPYGVTRLMELFSEMDSFKDQYYSFAFKLSPVILTLASHRSEGIISRMLVFLEHFIFQVNYNVMIGGYENIEASYSHLYTVEEVKYISLYEEVFFTALRILETLGPSYESILPKFIRILERLWQIFSAYSTHLIEILSLALRECSNCQDEALLKSAASFLYRVLNSDDIDFKQKKHLRVERLMNHPSFCKNILLFEADEAKDFESLNVQVAFPLARQVLAGGKTFQIVEVEEPNCILYWGFATKCHDISYSITRVDLPEPQILISEHRVNCSESHLSGIRLLHSPGFYMFLWDNSYSWLREKQVRFRVAVLKPLNFIHIKRDTEENSTIQVYSQRKTHHTEESPTVGVYISSSHIYLKSNDAYHVCDYTEDSEIESVISSFIDALHLSNATIGIIAADLVLGIKIRTAKSIATAKATDAIALYHQKLAHSYSLISVICDNSYRSSIVFKGKVLLSEQGNALGDISTLSNEPLLSKLTKLLCLFGPARLIIGGSTFTEDRTHFKEALQEQLPTRIRESSEIAFFEDKNGPEVALALHSF